MMNNIVSTKNALISGCRSNPLVLYVREILMNDKKIKIKNLKSYFNVALYVLEVFDEMHQEFRFPIVEL